ncbi:MAG: gamma-glutamyltransferase [Phycisphaerales bacterium]|nr:gamma-glutamyltransferase [Phycisphaerales bacterium]
MLVVAVGVRAPALGDDPPWIARGHYGMVASDSAEASAIGARVLEEGGNAFDAAVATSLALTVARPQSTGIGGGGFLVAWLADEKRAIALDFRESAPMAATAERYARLAEFAGDGPSPSVYGGAAVGVPGLVAGLGHVHDRYGSREWVDLVSPAVDLAMRGVLVDEHLHEAIEDALKEADKWPSLRKDYAGLFGRFAPDGVVPSLGARIRRDDLARALRIIAIRGGGAMREGPLADAILRAIDKSGGIMMSADLRDYVVKEREPVRISYHGCEIITMPPPSSGGVCAAITLRALEAVGDFKGDPQREMLARVEAMKHGFADRSRWLGDTDFAKAPVAFLLNQDYGARVSDALKQSRTMKPEAYGTTEIKGSVGGAAKDDGGTSHFCIIDRAGNVVSMTETINGGFGSFVVAEPYGIILNNELDDFLTVRGAPNMFGLRQSEANLIAPGKRPLSSMTPTIVLRDGRPILALGGSGGPRIISSTLHVLLNVINDGASLEDALRRIRPHHQWAPDVVYFDEHPPTAMADAFSAFGHELSDERRKGVVQAIQIMPNGELIGGSDPRKGGRPVGVER